MEAAAIATADIKNTSNRELTCTIKQEQAFQKDEQDKYTHPLNATHAELAADIGCDSKLIYCVDMFQCDKSTLTSIHGYAYQLVFHQCAMHKVLKAYKLDSTTGEPLKAAYVPIELEGESCVVYLYLRGDELVLLYPGRCGLSMYAVFR